MSNKDQAKITAQIIDGLENLKGDWKKSWVTAGSPINPDGRLYQGINILVLLFASARHGFSSNEWGTYQSWKRRGGQVQGGQKSPATIVAVVPTTITEENDDGEVTRSFNRMKTYSVFNIDQVDGVTNVTSQNSMTANSLMFAKLTLQTLGQQSRQARRLNQRSICVTTSPCRSRTFTHQRILDAVTRLTHWMATSGSIEHVN